jgi:hypothetical protein
MPGNILKKMKSLGILLGSFTTPVVFGKYVHVLDLGTAFLVCAAQLNERLCRPLSYDVL